MSGLIKGKEFCGLMTMDRLRLLTFIGIFVVMALFVSPTKASFTISQDITAPTIHAWGIEGDPMEGLGFDVWANVSDDEILNDDDPALRNVTVQVTGPNMTLNGLMAFNGTFYTGSVPAFPNDGTFRVRIRAFDLANNTRNSAYVNIDFEAEPEIPIDPNITMPIVVTSGIGLIVVVIILARYYDRRRNPVA
ncbi:MAG: hypothetical protein ACFFF9_11040 [Candidatus Thorarchaeota archaeon]